MMMQEFEGKNREEAIKKAIEMLEIPEEELQIEYLDDGKAGFFGFRGGRPARIRVYYEEVESSFSRKARSFVQGLLERLGLNPDITYAKEEKETLFIKISCDSSGLVIGKKGKNLEAIQFLVNVVMNKDKEQWKKIILDIEGYRSKREESIKRLALRTASIVRKTHNSRLLDTMNPYERRLVHVTLQDFNDVETKSEGEGLYKKVRIIPTGGGGRK